MVQMLQFINNYFTSKNAYFMVIVTGFTFIIILYLEEDM